MNKSGCIVIIDDDIDDREILQEIFRDLHFPNEIKYFNAVHPALEYLSRDETQPFIILSDLHLHELDGFQLQEMIKNNSAISRKCIPLIFITTGTTKENLARIYKESTQGVFIKPPQYDQWKNLLQQIYEYWQYAIAP